MPTISTTDFMALADNVAKTVKDMKTALITNPASNAPTVTTINNGQTAASNSLEARVLALNDITQEAALAGLAIETATTIGAFLLINPSQIYTCYIGLMVALESLVGGVNAYLTANVLQVHPEFANVFNYTANNAVSLGVASADFIPISVNNQNAGRSISY